MKKQCSSELTREISHKSWAQGHEEARTPFPAVIRSGAERITAGNVSTSGQAGQGQQVIHVHTKFPVSDTARQVRYAK